MKHFLGIDVGSISTNLAILREDKEIIDTLYLRTEGNPIRAVQEGLAKIETVEISGVCTTGSGRKLAGIVAGADLVKTEIIAHAVAAQHIVPDVQTILEIGGQDSKIIILRNKIVVDFAMNSICAAGCGAFLDHQAGRLKVPIEQFGSCAVRSKVDVNIAGRCTVFAESDMIHKQQAGYKQDDIIRGLCSAIVRNYLNNVGKGKEILPPIVFQGGVAANQGVRQAFEREMETGITVPPHFDVMGAIGAALLVIEEPPEETKFKGSAINEITFTASSFACDGCGNKCEIVTINQDGSPAARWGGRCEKWDI